MYSIGWRNLSPEQLARPRCLEALLHGLFAGAAILALDEQQGVGSVCRVFGSCQAQPSFRGSLLIICLLFHCLGSIAALTLVCLEQGSFALPALDAPLSQRVREQTRVAIHLAAAVVAEGPRKLSGMSWRGDFRLHAPGPAACQRDPAAVEVLELSRQLGLRKALNCPGQSCAGQNAETIR